MNEIAEYTVKGTVKTKVDLEELMKKDALIGHSVLLSIGTSTLVLEDVELHKLQSIWIFNLNPDCFEVDKYLEQINTCKRKYIYPGVKEKQNIKEMLPGDLVYIYRSVEKQGIIAKGIIVDVPRPPGYYSEEDLDEKKLWKDEKSEKHEKLKERYKDLCRVKIGLIEVRLNDGMLKRDFIKSIVGNPFGRIEIKIDSGQYLRIEKMWNEEQR